MNVWKDYLWTGLHGNRFGGCMLILQLPISNTRIFKLHGFCQVIDVIAEKKKRKSEKNNFNEKQTWVKQVCTPAANDIFFLYRLTASIKNEEKKTTPTHTELRVLFQPFNECIWQFNRIFFVQNTWFRTQPICWCSLKVWMMEIYCSNADTRQSTRMTN